MEEIKIKNFRPWLGSMGVMRLAAGGQLIKLVDQATGVDRLTVVDTTAKIRRRIENRLRKDPQAVLEVADLLGIYPTQQV